MSKRLQTRAESVCQRLLTAENRVCGGAPERVERRVGLEGLREVLGALRTELVGCEPASEGEFRVSAAIDSGIRACGGSLERGDRRVCLEEVGHDLCTLHPELVAPETASEGRIPSVSGY